MSDYFVDLNKVASGDGLSKPTAWNFADISTAPVLLANNDNVYVKGSISSINEFLFYVATPASEVVNILPWDDEMSAWVGDFTTDMTLADLI